MPSVIVVADSETDEPSAFSHDRRSFQLKERVRSSDVSDPHLAAQLIQRIGWALADAEDAEQRLGAPAVTPIPSKRTMSLSAST